MKRVIFAGYGKDSIHTIEPLFSALKKRGVERYFIPGYTGPVREKSVREVEVLHPPPLETACGIVSKRNSLRAASTLFLERGLAYFDLSLEIQPNLIDFAQRVPLWTRHYYTFVKERLLELRPDLVVLPMTEICGEIVARVCRENDIPLCYVVTYHTEIRSDEHRQITDDTNLYLIAGTYGRDRLIQKGLSPSNIVITGTPLFEKTFARKKTHQRERSDKDRKVILFTMSGNNLDEHLYVYNLLRQYVSNHSDATLLVRPHPLGPLGYETFPLGNGGELSEKIFLHKKTDTIEDALLSSDVLVTLASGTMLEALILGTPIIYWHTDFLPPAFPLASNGDALPADTAENLFINLDKILFEPKFRKTWLYDHRSSHEKYFSKEQATHNILEVFEKISQRKISGTTFNLQASLREANNCTKATHMNVSGHAKSTQATDTNTSMITFADDLSELNLSANERGVLVVSFSQELTYQLKKREQRHVRNIWEYGSQELRDFDTLYRSYSLPVKSLQKRCDPLSRATWLQGLLTDGILFNFVPILFLRDLISNIIKLEKPQKIEIAVSAPELKLALEFIVRDSIK